MSSDPFEGWGEKQQTVFLAGPAYPEALIALRIDGKLQVPRSWSPNLPPGTLRTRGHADYLMFHWPWSEQGDIDSHSMYSMN